MSTPLSQDETILAVDQSALEFYFEAVLPEIPEPMRKHMARAIRVGIETREQQARIEGRYAGAYEVADGLIEGGMTELGEKLKRRFDELRATNKKAGDA